MGKLWAAIEVLQKGRMLAEPGAWKNAQAISNVVAALGALAVLIWPQVADQIGPLVTGLSATAVAGLNVYLTLATSDKVGIGGVAPAKPDDNDTGTGIGI